jgi:WD40 repeat protein
MKVRGGIRRWRYGVALAAAVPMALTLMQAAGSEQTTNARFGSTTQVSIPGRGKAITWSPDGTKLALGGHFRDKAAKTRYDTRTLDVKTMSMAKSFDCHYWWAIAQSWQKNPYIGEVIADGGGDHSIKIWNANGPGSTRCQPGQIKPEDGGVMGLYKISGWITSLQFSPDGKWLAAASRDRSVRVWQIETGPQQWKLVKVFFVPDAGNLTSVRWAPDGRRLITGDRAGHVREFAWNPATDKWTPDVVAAVDKLGQEGQLKFFAKYAVVAPLWYSPMPVPKGVKKPKMGSVWNVRYSPDGNRIASTNTTGALTVYEARTGRVLYTVNAPKNTELHGLDWSPDGALIAVGAKDKNIYVYDAVNGSLYDTITGHKQLVTAVAWSPNGKTLASTAGGQLVQLATNQASEGPDDAVHFWNRK